ncbi:MAG: AAA family ATPase, partial [Gemmatimonadota bacterium]
MGKAVQIRLLGVLELLHDGQPVKLPASKKARALLGYLIVTQRPHLREHLCDLLWEGPDDPRAALRWALSRLREPLDDAAATRLLADRERVAFEPRGADIDLVAVRACVARGVAQASIDELRVAAKRFRGDLLEGLNLSRCYRFHEWCLGEREALQTLHVSILGALAARLDDPEAALSYARERIVIDPLAEKGHIAVIKLLGALGRRRDALRQYEACREILAREVGVSPSADLERARLALTHAPAPVSGITEALSEPSSGVEGSDQGTQAGVRGDTPGPAKLIDNGVPSPRTVADDSSIQVPAAGPERRQLTAMHCDLLGSTTLSQHLDPEDLSAILRAYHECCSRSITRFEGQVVQYTGGILAYFGYPLAHEDDAERAIRAGLDIIDAVAELEPPHPEVSLEVGIGIATGLVVAGEAVGSDTFHEQLAIGETPNLAKRLQGLAEPNTLVVAADTRELAHDAFEYVRVSTEGLAGFSRSVATWHVIGPSRAQSRFEAFHPPPLTPLVGRAEEIALLGRRWQQAAAGEGQVALLSGDPGIGKSRIAEALQEIVAMHRHNSVRCQCSPYYKSSALYPIIRQLTFAAGLVPEDPMDRRLDKLEALLSRLTLSTEAMVPLFAALLAIPVEGRYPPLNVAPGRQKDMTLAAYVDYVAELAVERPVLFILEDVHWIDPTTRELVDTLVDQTQELPLLLVITFRPEFSPPWTAQTHVTLLTVNRLGRRQSEAMVVQAAGGKPFPEELLTQIVSKTDGVPLFIEEVTRAVLETGLLREDKDGYRLTRPISPLAVPNTLQASLLARLDRLASVKEVAQIGAVIGRQFSYELLAAVSPLDDEALQDALQQVTDAELLFRRGTAPKAMYTFKHALVQEAAYSSLLRSKRQTLHATVAQVLEERFPETANTEPELLAHHYTEAGDLEHAVAYWQRAGERAHEQSANLEAIGHLTTGIAVLQGLPDNQERARQELEFQVSLGSAIVCAKSHTAVEAQAAYTRARELCEQLGDVPELIPTLFGLWRFYVARSSLVEASELAMELLRLAEETDDAVRHVLAYYALGFTATCKGELADARHHFEKGTAQYSPSQRSADVYRAAQDPGVACRSWGSVTEWLLGFPDQAQDRMRESVALAEEIEDSFSLAYAKVIGAIVSEVCGNDAESKKMAQSGIDLAVEKGFPLWSVFGQISRNWILFKEEHTASMFDELCENVSAQSALISSFAPYFMTRLALAYRQAEQIEEGLHVLDSAQSLVEGRLLEGRGERWWEAEIHRLQGELLVSKSSENVGVAKA